jgi:hypothetical protein
LILRDIRLRCHPREQRPGHTQPNVTGRRPLRFVGGSRKTSSPLWCLHKPRPCSDESPALLACDSLRVTRPFGWTTLPVHTLLLRRQKTSAHSGRVTGRREWETEAALPRGLRFFCVQRWIKATDSPPTFRARPRKRRYFPPTGLRIGHGSAACPHNIVVWRQLRAIERGQTCFILHNDVRNLQRRRSPVKLILIISEEAGSRAKAPDLVATER